MANTQKYKISGLTCNACKKVTEKRIATIDGVTKVEVDLATGVAMVESDKDIRFTQINEVLKDTGYQVIQ